VIVFIPFMCIHTRFSLQQARFCPCR